MKEREGVATVVSEEEGKGSLPFFSFAENSTGAFLTRCCKVTRMWRHFVPFQPQEGGHGKLALSDGGTEAIL